MKSIAIYTTIFGRRDFLKPPPPGDYDFHCFTDDPSIPGATRIPLPVKGDPKRSASYMKCLAHKALPGYDAWIWMDASMKLKPDVNIQELLKASGELGAVHHGGRDCVYEEAKACVNGQLDGPGLIWPQMDRYRKLGYPPHAGLAAGGFMVRRDSPKIREFNEAWWAEISAGSCRDQLSLNPTAYRLGLKISYVGTLYDNPWMVLGKHLKLSGTPPA